MEVICITEIIDEIPRLLQYFISGFIFLKTFCFLKAIKENEVSFITIWSVVISFLITSTVKLFDSIIIPNHNLWLWAEVLICSLIGFVSAFIIYGLLNLKLFSFLLNKITHKSINTDIWKDVIDYDKGTILKVFLKTEI